MGRKLMIAVVILLFTGVMSPAQRKQSVTILRKTYENYEFSAQMAISIEAMEINFDADNTSPYFKSDS